MSIAVSLAFAGSDGDLTVGEVGKAIVSQNPFGAIALSIGEAIYNMVEGLIEMNERDKSGYIVIREYGGTFHFEFHPGSLVTDEFIEQFMEQQRASTLEQQSSQGEKVTVKRMTLKGREQRTITIQDREPGWTVSMYRNRKNI